MKSAHRVVFASLLTANLSMPLSGYGKEEGLEEQAGNKVDAAVQNADDVAKETVAAGKETVQHIKLPHDGPGGESTPPEGTETNPGPGPVPRPGK